MICTEMLEAERFRIGHTKIFFRAGVLGYLEEVRDDMVTSLTRKLQGALLAHLRRKEFSKRQDQRRLLAVIQRVFRRYLTLRHWGWFSVIQKTRPLIGMVNIEEEIQLLEDAATQAIQEFETTISERKRFEEANSQLMDEKMALIKRIEAEQGDLSAYTERQVSVRINVSIMINIVIHKAKAAAQKADIEAQLEEIKEKAVVEEEKKERLITEKKALDQVGRSYDDDKYDNYNFDDDYFDQKTLTIFSWTLTILTLTILTMTTLTMTTLTMSKTKPMIPMTDQETSSVRGELSDLEVAVSKVEQERSQKDHVIRSLNDDITSRSGNSNTSQQEYSRE